MNEVEFNELKDRVELLVKFITSEDEFYKIALENEWNLEMIEAIYRVMDDFLNLDNYDFAEIDKRFDEIGINHNDLKSLFNAFFKSGKYESVIRQYLKTNHEALGNVSSEYNEMYEVLIQKP